MKVLLIVPAFNENTKLELVAKRISEAQKKHASSLPFDALLADDASTDGAPERLSKQYGFCHLRHETRMGVGAVLRDAYFFGLRNQYDVLVTMAGNNKDNPDEIDRLVNPIKIGESDFVQGSRYLTGGSFGNMPGYRMISTRYIHPCLFSIASGQKITDSTNGYRAFKAELLKNERINLEQDWLNHYELEPYLFYQSIKFGYRVKEVPVTKIYPEKSLSYSKMIPIVSWWSILKPIFFLYFRIKK